MTMPASAEKIQFLEDMSQDRLSRLSSRRSVQTIIVTWSWPCIHTTCPCRHEVHVSQVAWVCYQRTRSVDTMKSGRAMRCVSVFGAGILLWFNP